MNSSSNKRHNEVVYKLNELKDFRNTLQPINDTLKTIIWDQKKHIVDKCNISVFFDFRELHRYLHPFLDFTAYYDSNKFYAEQLALEYLFVNSPFNLYLLPEYFEEYKLSLRSSFIQLTEFAIKPDDEIKRRVIKIDKVLSSFLKKTTNSLSLNKIQSFKDLPPVAPDILDFLFDSVRSDILKEGAKEYRNLLRSKNIQHAAKIIGLSKDDLEIKDSEEYSNIYDHLQAIRPSRKKSNEIDARAFHITQNLNKKYFSDNRLFLFVTSSTRIQEAFNSTKGSNIVVDKLLRTSMDGMSFMRDLQYFLLKFLVESNHKPDEPIDLTRFPDLVERYLKVTERLTTYFGDALTEIDSSNISFRANFEIACELHNELSPIMDRISEFSNFSTKGTSIYKSINERLKLPPILTDVSITNNAIRERIKESIKNPKVLTKHYSENAIKLNKAIQQIESNMATIIYKEDETDLVYDIHISNTSDKKLLLAANKIVSLLSMQNRTSFSKAYSLLSEIKSTYPNKADTLILSSKVYRAIRNYREAFANASKAIKFYPENSEAMFEYALCIRRLAQNENNYSLLQKAWKYCNDAKNLSSFNDPRILREISYLVWLHIEKYWTPIGEFPEPLSFVINNSENALSKAVELYGTTHILSSNIKNDLAYFLALSNNNKRIYEALTLIDSALKESEDLSDRVEATFLDTKGYILLQLYKLDKSNKDSMKNLKRAASYIRIAHKSEPDNLVRQTHLAEAMDLIMESLYWTKLDES